MKRIVILSLLLLLGVGVMMVVYADQERHSRPGGGKGYGLGHGMGHGMGHGKGYGMGHGMMMPFLDEVPDDKKKQLEQLHLSMSQAMMARMFDARREGKKLRDLLHAFSVDEKAAQAQWKVVNRIRGESFKLKLDMIARIQRILGEKLWSKMAEARMERHRKGRSPHR